MFSLKRRFTPFCKRCLVPSHSVVAVTKKVGDKYELQRVSADAPRFQCPRCNRPC